MPNPDTGKKVFDRIVIESANAKVGVNPEGGYVTSWQVKNPNTGKFDDVLYVGSVIKRTGIPILFPNYNDSGFKDQAGEDLMTHGFGRNSIWTIVQVLTSTKVTLTLNQNAISEEARKLYPYNFETSIEVEAAEDGSLLYSLNVKNTDSKPIPIAPGLHPYWAIPHSEKPNIQTEGLAGFNAASIDWDHHPPDTEYDFNGKVVIKTASKTITIEDLTPTPVVGKMVVWSQTPKNGDGEEQDHNFVCFEPITKGDNALANNPIKMEPGKEWNMNLKFSSMSL